MNLTPSRRFPLLQAAIAVSSTEQFTHACAECRKLITLQLQAREQLERALALAPDSPAVVVLLEKVGRLQASTAGAVHEGDVLAAGLALSQPLC